MNILVITSDLQKYDGWSTYSNGLLKELCSKEYKCTVLQQSRSFHISNKSKWLYPENLRFGIIFSLINALIITKYAIKYKPKAIINTTELSSISCRIARFLLFDTLPYIVVAHGTYGLKYAKRNLFSKLALKGADKVICVSSYTETVVKAYLPSIKSEVIHQGYDSESFLPDINVEKIPGKIVFVGNTKKRKGFNVLLDSIDLLPKEVMSRIELSLITPSLDEANLMLERTITATKLEKEQIVIHVGISNKQISDVLKSAMVNILPSLNDGDSFEGYGLVHVEAIASGCITIGSKNCGNECAISKGNGFLIEQGASSQIARIITYLIDNPMHWSPKGQQPTKWDECIKKYQRILEKYK